MNKRERISQWLAEATGENVNPDQADVERHPYYLAFFRCWNEQRYYEAHDVLEQLWLKTKSRLAQKNLANFAPWHHALDVAALCKLLSRYADEIVASDYTINPWSPETAPKLELG